MSWLDFNFIKPLNRCILYKGYPLKAKQQTSSRLSRGRNCEFCFGLLPHQFCQTSKMKGTVSLSLKGQLRFTNHMHQSSIFYFHSSHCIIMLVLRLYPQSHHAISGWPWDFIQEKKSYFGSSVVTFIPCLLKCSLITEMTCLGS